MESKLYRGKVVGSEGGLYKVVTEDGMTLECPARGVFRHEGLKVLVGDNVTVRDENLSESDGGGKIESKKGGLSIFEVDERKNELIRPSMANLDILFIVFAAARPDPMLVNVDKLTAVAVENEIEPVIIVTKADIDGEKAEKYAEIYRKSGFHAFVAGDDRDVSELGRFILSHAKGKTSAFAGASGVGKSTLLTKLFPGLKLETGELSQKIQRGKHTTRHTKLYMLSEIADGLGEDDELRGGFIADTPGFGILDFVAFDFFTKEDLPFNFREFVPYITKCRYTKCTHLKEEGCAIIEAVEKGEIMPERHESYVSIYEDLKSKPAYPKKPPEKKKR